MPEHDSIPELSLDACARAIAVNKTTPHALFLGAGASLSSGVQSAELCIWDWKRRLFLSQNPAFKRHVEDLSATPTRARLQRWVDAQGRFPERDHVTEYSALVEACYPVSSDRRQYFQSLVAAARPHLGYRLAALLAKSRCIQSVWTTNFDRLFPKAAAEVDVTTVEIGLDTTSRLSRPMRVDEIRHVTLHGDYRYDALKNTSTELQQQDEALRASFVEMTRSTTVVVIGYSGRDESIMQMFEQAYLQTGSGRLYWCQFGEDPTSENARRIISIATSRGREAFLVRGVMFDDLLIRVALLALPSDQKQKIEEYRAALGLEEQLKLAPFGKVQGPYSKLLKSNAFPLTPPSEVLEFSPVDGIADLWAELRTRTEGRPIVAVPYRKKIVAVGDSSDCASALSDLVTGAPKRVPITPSEWGSHNLSHLLATGIVTAISNADELATDGRGTVWDSHLHRSETTGGESYQVHDAAHLAVRWYGGRLVVTLDPTVIATEGRGVLSGASVQKEIRRKCLVRQWNRKYNDDLNVWRKKLFGTKARTLTLGPNARGASEVTVHSQPIFAGVTQSRSSPLPKNVLRSVGQDGQIVSEPSLAFSSKDGTSVVMDPHPMRGLRENRPYDWLVTKMDSSPVRVGVICPSDLQSRVYRFLSDLHLSVSPDTKKEYLLEYPGFSGAFGVGLELPGPESQDWLDFQDPPEVADGPSGSRLLATALQDAIERFIATTGGRLLVIVVPNRWASVERYRTPTEAFDLHDYIKAYCAQRGIATQLLREATLDKHHLCELRWWLALAMYTKAMRTPWALQIIDRSTAFAGIGFSLQPKSPDQNGHVMVGCSHLYSSDGVGLRYRLTRLEESVYRRRNPFLSKADAARLGRLIRQILLETGQSLPNRLVIHRRSPFRKEEIDGLLQSLDGIDTIDLIEIGNEPRLRYVASSARGAKSIPDAFPVDRGTVIRIDHQRLLLWVHGAVPAIQTGRTYFLGKSRIPAPLFVRKHFGPSDAATIATELLGLSKMNWNTFDHYTLMPATLHSSNAIARVGALLSRFDARSYDYRLFM